MRHVFIKFLFGLSMLLLALAGKSYGQSPYPYFPTQGQLGSAKTYLLVKGAFAIDSMLLPPLYSDTAKASNVKYLGSVIRVSDVAQYGVYIYVGYWLKLGTGGGGGGSYFGGYGLTATSGGSVFNVDTTKIVKNDTAGKQAGVSVGFAKLDSLRFQAFSNQFQLGSVSQKTGLVNRLPLFSKTISGGGSLTVDWNLSVLFGNFGTIILPPRKFGTFGTNANNNSNSGFVAGERSDTTLWAMHAFRTQNGRGILGYTNNVGMHPTPGNIDVILFDSTKLTELTGRVLIDSFVTADYYVMANGSAPSTSTADSVIVKKPDGTLATSVAANGFIRNDSTFNTTNVAPQMGFAASKARIDSLHFRLSTTTFPNYFEAKFGQTVLGNGARIALSTNSGLTNRTLTERWFTGSGGGIFMLGARGANQQGQTTSNHNAAFSFEDRTISDRPFYWMLFSEGGLGYLSLGRESARFTSNDIATRRDVLRWDSTGNVTVLTDSGKLTVTGDIVNPNIDSGASSRYVAIDANGKFIKTVTPLTSVGLTSSTLTVSGSPLTANGSITAEVDTTKIRSAYQADTAKANLRTEIAAKRSIDTAYTQITITGGAVTFDCQNRQSKGFYIDMTSNITSITFTNTVTRGEYEVWFYQDATGGRTATGWATTGPNTIDWVGTTTPPTLTPTATTGKDCIVFKKGPKGNLVGNVVADIKH